MTDAEADAIQRALGRIESGVASSHQRLDKIDETLKDNGADIAVLKSQMGDVRGADASAKTSRTGAVVAVGAGGAGIVALIAQILREVLGK